MRSIFLVLILVNSLSANAERHADCGENGVYKSCGSFSRACIAKPKSQDCETDEQFADKARKADKDAYEACKNQPTDKAYWSCYKKAWKIK